MVWNTFDNYHSGNPVIRMIMQDFESSLMQLLNEANPSSIHEIGCGEGYWVLSWLEQGLVARGSDFSNTVINQARNNAIG